MYRGLTSLQELLVVKVARWIVLFRSWLKHFVRTLTAACGCIMQKLLATPGSDYVSKVSELCSGMKVQSKSEQETQESFGMVWTHQIAGSWALYSFVHAYCAARRFPCYGYLICIYNYIYIHIHVICKYICIYQVVPHKAVAEVSK